MADEEWGEWQDHSGWGCPLPNGTVAEAEAEWRGTTYRQIGVVGDGCKGAVTSTTYTPWAWRYLPERLWRMNACIVRYRVKKPKSLTILEEIIADIPAPTNPKVDA